jgi:predicted GNAT family acetyltransferase
MDVVEHNRFELYQEDARIGWLRYQRARKVLVLEHTEVNREYRRQGHAGQLVKAALDQAKSDRRRVIVVCPYAKDWLRRHPEYAELDYAFGH